MRHNAKINLARINTHSRQVDSVELTGSVENIKSTLEELLGGLVGLLKLDGGFFLLYNSSEFTQERLEFNEWASWFVSKMAPEHQDDPIKVYGNVLIGSYTEDEPNTLRSVDFNSLYGIFSLNPPGEGAALSALVSYGPKFSTN